MTGSETGSSEDADHISGPGPGNGSEATFVASFAAVLRRTVDPVDLLAVFLKGMFMGAADTVPGVSGGTIALVTGIYERLISAITAVDVDDVFTAWRLYDSEGRQRFLDVFERVDVPFVGALGLGIVTAVVTVARVIEVVKSTYPAATFAVFFGLIAASAVVLYGEVDVTEPRRLALAVLGIVGAALVAFSSGGEAAGAAAAVPLWYVFLAGTIAISAMVLPGVSGAFLLILLGSYSYMLGTLNDFTGAIVGLIDGGGLGAVFEPGIVVVTFCTGAVVGLLTVAHAIRWALDNNRSATLTFLVSLMVGGLVAPAQKVAGSITPTPTGYGLVVAGAIVGAAGVLLFDHFTDDLDY